MKIKTYLKPENLKEASALLNELEGAQIFGGGAWLKILPKEIETAIDLSFCNLEYISESLDRLEIGSYCSLRKLENFPAISSIYDGILGKSIGEVMGVPFRNIATIGGTVAGKFGFSDILTPLLALNTELIFYKRGMISLESYLLEKGFHPDILVGIRIEKTDGKGYFYTLKKTANDFSIINIAITKNSTGYRIAIGARPGVAMLAREGMKYLNENKELNKEGKQGLNQEVINQATAIILEEISFGSNTRGSKEYRQEVIKGLLGRGLAEVNR